MDAAAHLGIDLGEPESDMTQVALEEHAGPMEPVVADEQEARHHDAGVTSGPEELERPSKQLEREEPREQEPHVDQGETEHCVEPSGKPTKPSVIVWSSFPKERK